MITGQLSKPLLSLRGEMEGAELREDERAPSPDSETNEEPLLLPPDAEDKLYGEYIIFIILTSFVSAHLLVLSYLDLTTKLWGHTRHSRGG
ncbi:POU domain, class 6, transcription factor 2 isoform X1 [Tachysurus ichikawai]